MDDSACSGHALGEACEELTVRSNQLGGLKRRFAMKRKRAVGKGGLPAALKRRGGATLVFKRRELLWEAGKRWKGDVPLADITITVGLEMHVCRG